MSKHNKGEGTKMEYEDAPSGFVVLYSHKLPLMKFEEGYGFRGVLLMDGSGKTIQCHFCGDWFETLQAHIRQAHSMNVHEYRKAVGLFKKTALISDTFRERLISNYLKRDLSELGQQKGEKRPKEVVEKMLESRKEMYKSFEWKNSKGTCPAQLLDRLTKLADKLGRTPTSKEVSFLRSLTNTYGTYENALKRAGLEPNKVGVYRHTSRADALLKSRASRYATGQWLSDETIYEDIRRFYKVNNRIPRASDFRRKLMNVGSYTHLITRFGGYKKLIRKAGLVYDNV